MHALRSIFSSLQGEGRNTGRPCTFIRYSSCNFSCPWCDTKKETKFTLSTKEVLQKVLALKNKSVIITGGEPTIQPGLEELLDALTKNGYWVALETNGLVAPSFLDKFDYIAVSPKYMYQSRYNPSTMIRKANEVRIVATSDDIASYLRSIRQLITADDYYISPLEEKGKMHYRRAMNLLVKINKLEQAMPPWQLSIQTHKVLGLR
jgi:organic radical activating enzyme